MTRLHWLATAGLAAMVGAAVAAPGSATAAPAVVHQPARVLRSAAVRQLGWSSANWSGYAETSAAPYHQIGGSWVVPSVASSTRATYSSAWIGIDGYTNSDLIQTGTESDYSGGRAHYDAWWEILPASETVIPSITVRPGDHMQAEITEGSNSMWTITITDRTTGATFTTVQSYQGPGASAEWIVERPEVGGFLAPLAHYASPLTMDPGTANGGNPHLTASDGGAMTTATGKVQSIPSVPDADTDGFNCSFGSRAPAPPSS